MDCRHIIEEVEPTFGLSIFEELEFVGATFMYLDQGIDTGKIIHQIRARIYENDNLHIIGNRLISDAIIIYKELIKILKMYIILYKMIHLKQMDVL